MPTALDAGTSGAGTSHVLLLYLLLVLCAVGVIWLQIFLSKKEKRWPGLVLPVISFCVSLLVLLSYAVYTEAGGGTIQQNADGTGIIIVEPYTYQLEPSISPLMRLLPALAVVFPMCNIPTVILLAIYASCRRKRKDTVERMSVQDLE